jgi:hypothetical protein
VLREGKEKERSLTAPLVFRKEFLYSFHRIVIHGTPGNSIRLIAFISFGGKYGNTPTLIMEQLTMHTQGRSLGTTQGLLGG